ncbi:MAG: hypothetical protein AB7F64_09995 [Gammaproteobacteria bacterium]
MTKYWIYLIGVLILGLSHEFLKTNLNSYAFVGVGITYLLGVNYLAHKFGKDKDIED